MHISVKRIPSFTLKLMKNKDSVSYF